MMLGVASFLTVFLLSGSHAWKNSYDQRLNFQCPEGQYISRWKSQHSNYYDDRVFDFECRPGVVGSECVWSDYTADYDKPFDYECPENHIVTGVDSVHANYYDDRRFKFRCCKIVSKPGTKCYKTDWLNSYDKAMDYKVEPSTAIVGVKSTHHNYYDDRVFAFKICSFAICTANKIRILDVIRPKVKGNRQVGFATSQGCAEHHEYTLHLGKTDTLEETTSVTLTKGTEFNYGTSLSVEATASAGFLGTGASVTVGVTQSFGGAVTAETSNTKETMTGHESSSEVEVAYQGPAAALIIADVTEYVIDKSDVNVAVDVTCDDGSSFVEKKKMAFSSKTYSQTHFTTKTAKFHNADYCTRATNDCLRNLRGEHAVNPYAVIDGFIACFEGKAIVAK